MKSFRFILLIVAALVVSACQPDLSADRPAPRPEATAQPLSTPRPTVAPPERPTPEGKTYAPSDGAFSIVMPEGWNDREVAGLMYHAILGPTSSAFAPNLNFVDEAFAGSLQE